MTKNCSSVEWNNKGFDLINLGKYQEAINKAIEIDQEDFRILN